MQWQGAVLILAFILIFAGMFLMWGWPVTLILAGVIAMIAAFGSM